jgi:hypothetical protein
MLKEEHRQRLFEQRDLRKIFGPKTEELIGGFKKLYDEELYNLYCSSIIIRVKKSRKMRCLHQARGEEKCVQVVGGET